jgi:hypothetical protein
LFFGGLLSGGGKDEKFLSWRDQRASEDALLNRHHYGGSQRRLLKGEVSGLIAEQETVSPKGNEVSEIKNRVRMQEGAIFGAQTQDVSFVAPILETF